MIYSSIGLIWCFTLFTALSASFNSSYVMTTLGWRPKECVHYANEEVILTPKDNGMEAYYPNSNRIEFHPQLDICVEDAKKLSLKNKAKNKNSTPNIGVTTWEVYSSATMPSDMGTFKGTYTVPNESPSPQGGELLYFFLGLQNDGQPDLSIIQPVISYCADCDDSQLPKGWSMMATNCCINGMTWFGPIIPIEAGATIAASVSVSNQVVFITEQYQNQVSSLTVKDIDRDFNWAAVTLEQYFVDTCSQYNSVPFNVSGMVLTSEDGKSIDPKWTANNENNCGGKADIVNDYEVLIYGTIS